MGKASIKVECLSPFQISQTLPPNIPYYTHTHHRRQSFTMSRRSQDNAPWQELYFNTSNPREDQESQQNVSNIGSYATQHPMLLQGAAQYPSQGPGYPATLSPMQSQGWAGYSGNPIPPNPTSYQPYANTGEPMGSCALVYPYQSANPEWPSQFAVPDAAQDPYLNIPYPSLQYASSADNSDVGSQESGFTSLSARRQSVNVWMSKTNLTPAQVEVAHSIINSTWWANEDPEPEVQHGDMLAQRRLVPIGGSRFRIFLDEENGYKCAFDHDGEPCGHGKGRPERALGTIRRFFRYRPVRCNGSCGVGCNLRFVSTEQCQKHVQKRRAGRSLCSDCGSWILTSNMGRHRKSCQPASSSRR